MCVPNIGAPRVVPVSGGGYHFEWSVGNRELEFSIEPSGRLEALCIQDSIPVEESPALDLATLFGWLISE